MECTMEAVLDDGMLVNKAAILHGVPCSTLKDCLSGCVIHGRKPGPQPYLDGEEEKELTDKLIDASDSGLNKDMKKDMI